MENHRLPQIVQSMFFQVPVPESVKGSTSPPSRGQDNLVEDEQKFKQAAERVKRRYQEIQDQKESKKIQVLEPGLVKPIFEMKIPRIQTPKVPRTQSPKAPRRRHSLFKTRENEKKKTVQKPREMTDLVQKRQEIVETAEDGTIRVSIPIFDDTFLDSLLRRGEALRDALILRNCT